MNEHNLYDIYGTVHVPWWQSTAFYIAIIIICMLIGVLGIFFIWRHIRTKRLHLFPWQKALLRIEKLESISLGTDDARSSLYSTLTLIIKEYMVERYQIKIVGKTDQEMLSVAVHLALSDEVTKHMQQLYHASTEIKFAKGVAAQEMITRDLSSAAKIINLTIPIEDNKL